MSTYPEPGITARKKRFFIMCDASATLLLQASVLAHLSGGVTAGDHTRGMAIGNSAGDHACAGFPNLAIPKEIEG
jgi:hypothetical protein